jgi:trigger factor
MKTELEDLGGSQKKILCEVPSEEVQKEVDKYCRTLAKEVEVRGFRKGKAPPSIIKRYFRQQIQREVASQLVSSSLEEALKEHSLTPLGEPEIDAPMLEEEKDYTFSIKLDVKPEIEISDYEGIELEEDPSDVEEEEVEKSLDELRKAHGDLKGIEEDRPAAEGDTVLVDYAAFVDGEPIPDYERKDVYMEIGSGNVKQDVEAVLLGARVGHEGETEVDYPANFTDKNLAGKRVQYRLRVKKILVKELPELDDEFAKDVGPYETLEGLKERLREEIGKEKKARNRRALEEALLEEILNRNALDAPRSLVEARHSQMMKEAKIHFLTKGLQMEEDSEDYQKLEANLGELAERDVKKHLLVEAIAKKESIQVSDEEMEEKIREIADQHEQSVEKVKADIQKQEQGLENFRANLLRGKTLDFLLSKATIKDKEKTQQKRPKE